MALAVALTGCQGRLPEVPYPTDAELVERLTSHRAAFDSLLAEGFRPELLSELDVLRRTAFFVSDTTVSLVAWAKDIVGPGGCGKGYVYLTTPPSAAFLVDSLGVSLGECGPEEMRVFRPVDGNWYLYFTAAN